MGSPTRSAHGALPTTRNRVRTVWMGRRTNMLLPLAPPAGSATCVFDALTAMFLSETPKPSKSGGSDCRSGGSDLLEPTIVRRRRSSPVSAF